MPENTPDFSELQKAKTEPLKKVGLSTILASAKAEDTSLNLFTKLEEKENGGRLPKPYSTLTFSEMRSTLHNPDLSLLEEKPGMTEKELETARLLETGMVVKKNEKNIGIVRTARELANPLGKIGDTTLIMVADEHKAPSFAVEGTRSLSFNNILYAIERTFLGISETLDQRKRFHDVPRLMHAENHPHEPIPPLNVERRLIDRTDSRQLYDSWLTSLIAKEEFRENDKDASQPILFSLGDRVTDGAFLLDQFEGTGKYYEMMEEVKYRNETLQLKFLQLNGNHDQDARTPESLAMLTELFGHNVFAQEMGGVLTVAIDTNIENPVWMETFLKHADEEGKKVLAEKQKLQEILIQILEKYQGPILLAGHHPSRVVEAMGVKRQVLQNSNVQAILGGHTHVEAHWETPILNKSGEPIALHVLESVSRSKNGKLEPPKAYAVRLQNGKIGFVRTIQESQGDFDKRYEELQMVKRM